MKRVQVIIIYMFICCIYYLSENAAEIIGTEGGIQDILAAMRAFPKELELSSNCCTALWSLSVVGMTTVALDIIL